MLPKSFIGKVIVIGGVTYAAAVIGWGLSDRAAYRPHRVMKDPQDKFPYAGFIGGGPTNGGGATDDQLMLQQQTAGRFTIIGN